MEQIDLSFRIVPSRISEDDDLPSDPEQHVRVLSRRKAEDVAHRVDAGLVLGADTVVVIDETVLGKPSDPEDAISMLSWLSGRTHRVLTGLTLVRAPMSEKDGKAVLSDVVATSVRMRVLSRAEIEWYVSTGEPMDKAGAYGIQGKGAVLVACVEGCFYNVVGLPLSRLIAMLRRMGYDLREGEDGT